MKKKPTIRDVAAQAGRVDRHGLEVHQLDPALHRPASSAGSRPRSTSSTYHSNPLARSMITGKTGSVGVVILDICNPHFTNIVKGANRVALEHGYNLLFVDTEESQAREDELLDALSRRVDGLIVSTRMPEDKLAACSRGASPWCSAAAPRRRASRASASTPTPPPTWWASCW